MKKTTILEDATVAALRVETPRLPDALPRFTVKATVEVTMKDGSRKEYTKEVAIDVRTADGTAWQFLQAALSAYYFQSPAPSLLPRRP